MRKSKLLVMALLAVAGAFTSCSSDDVATDKGTEELKKGEAYMAVQLVAPKADIPGKANTRATFDNGTDAENTIKNVLFIFYDKEGNYVTNGIPHKYSAGEGTDQPNGGNISRIYNAVIAVSTTEKESPITQVLAVANYDGNANYFTGKSITEITNYEKLQDSELVNYKNSTGAFVMSSSAYVSGDNLVNTSDCTGKFFSSEDEALKNGNSVKIYVERLASKVSVKDNTASAANMSDATIDGENKNVTVKVLGWALNATEPQSYLIKNISHWKTSTLGEYDTAYPGWNDATNFRSYWAEDRHYYGQSYPTTGYTGTTDLTKTFLNYATFNEIKASNDPAYCNENTNIDFSQYLQASTSVLVGAQILVGTGDQAKAEDLVKYRGALQTIDSYKANVLTNSVAGSYYKKDASAANGYKQIEISDIEVIGSKENSTLTDGAVATRLTAAAEKTIWYTEDKDNNMVEATTAVSDINNALLVSDVKGEGFKEGKMYYSVPIKHLQAIADKTQPTKIGQIGVVRNHAYTINLNKISGIGHGVWNPEEHIVPVDELTRYYLAAELNVLPWNILPAQDVELGK